MPALRLFGRKTLLGGDDLQPAVFVALLLRLVQLIVLLYPLLRHSIKQKEDACRTSQIVFGDLLQVYATASAVYTVLTIVLDQRIAVMSSRGAPVETHPRQQRVAQLVQLKLGIWTGALLCIWTCGMASLVLALTKRPCDNEETLEEWKHEDASSAVTATEMQQNSLPAYWSGWKEEGVRDTVYWMKDAADDDSGSSAASIFFWLALILLLSTQLTEIILSWLYVLHLLQQPRYDSIDTGQVLVPSPTENHHLAEAMWAERCASACRCMSVASCFLFGGQEVIGTSAQDSFAEVARALADYLETRGVLDVVPSDIVTGLVLLQRLQRQRVYEARRVVLDDVSVAAPLQAVERGEPLPGAPSLESSVEENADLMAPRILEDAPMGRSRQQSFYRIQTDGITYQQQQRSVLSRRQPADLAHLEEGARYAKFALAIYTWVLYLYVHPVTGPARLIARSHCGCHRRRKRRGFAVASTAPTPLSSPRLSASLVDEHGRIEGDNVCATHKAALLLTAGLEETDLVYAQLRSSFHDNPYCILLDHEWQSVVVSIRGTFSLEDCVTDVLIDPESLEQLGHDYGFDATDQYCHGGVLACVNNIYRDLQRHGLLERLLVGERAPYADYSLRLVGHSLGAASCTLLSFMLRPKFPTIRCVNYSPPGCSLTWEMATACQEWTTTFVMDSDLVPRLTIDSMERLRDGVLEMIGRARVPKIQVAKLLVGGTRRSRCIPWVRITGNHSSVHGEDVEEEEEDVLVRNLREMLHPPNEVPESTYQVQLRRFQAIQEQRKQTRGYLRSIKLYPPGRIIHLTKTGEQKSCLHGLAKCLTCCTTSFGSEYTPVWIKNDDLNEIVVSPTMGTDHFPTRMRMVLEGVAHAYGMESAGD